ncbi:MAG: DUF2752 domain-containing protein [Acidimicrobiales bacterium]
MSEDRVSPTGLVSPATAFRGESRVGRLAALAGVAAVTTFVGLVDPSRGGAYPVCPSRALFGVDCPACGGLRGTHDLLHGHLGEALDHNLLLPGILAVLAVAFASWLLPLAGRPARALALPRWATVVAVGVAVAFTVLRNLPVASLEFLGSS